MDTKQEVWTTDGRQKLQNGNREEELEETEEKRWWDVETNNSQEYNGPRL